MIAQQGFMSHTAGQRLGDSELAHPGEDTRVQSAM